MIVKDIKIDRNLKNVRLYNLKRPLSVLTSDKNLQHLQQSDI